MIPSDKLVDRNTNVFQIARALIEAKEYRALCHLGELISEQHRSLRRSFVIITNSVEDIMVSSLREAMENDLREDK